MEPEWKMNVTCMLTVEIRISLGRGMGLTTADKDRVRRSQMEGKIEGSVPNNIKSVGIGLGKAPVFLLRRSWLLWSLPILQPWTH